MDVKLPKLGEGADSGVVVGIFVNVGDTVAAGQAILELENEKAVASVPSTAAATHPLARSASSPPPHSCGPDAACALAGFSTQRVGGYPGWKPEPGAWLVTVIAEAWKAQSGQEIDVMAIHAGLECGLIGEKYPGMEMASFGPDVRDAHTPEENLSISSTQRFWSLLVDVLERLAKG